VRRKMCAEDTPDTGIDGRIVYYP